MSHVRWGLLIFITPVLVWLTLLILLPQVDMFIMSIRAENELGELEALKDLTQLLVRFEALSLEAMVDR